MNILILNWRDLHNPKAGGAERITARYAQYWVTKGHSVVWFTNSYNRAKKSEVENGVHYKRIGPALSSSFINNLIFYPSYLFQTIRAVLQWSKEHEVDLVIDEIHGLPFLTPLYLASPKVLLVCEVAGPIWDKMYPFPLNSVGKILEKLTYRLYRKTPMWAISENTKRDILKLQPQADVKILPLGIDVDKKLLVDYRTPQKSKNPSAVFLARLVPMKGIEAAIEVAELISRTLPDFTLLVIGKGDRAYEKHLKDLVTSKNLTQNVQFLGRLDEAEKYQILASSHFLLHPSYKEGFGLTVLEAGLVGTPAIIRDGSSLNELVDDRKSGFIAKTEDEMADIFIASFNHQDYSEFVKNSRAKALTFDWPKILGKSASVTNL